MPNIILFEGRDTKDGEDTYIIGIQTISSFLQISLDCGSVQFSSLYYNYVLLSLNYKAYHLKLYSHPG